MSKKNIVEGRNEIVALDFFCGVGGVTHGFLKSGIKVLAGIDNDSGLAKDFEKNNYPAKFYLADVSDTQSVKNIVETELHKHSNAIKVFAACAPCQPFSNQGRKYSSDSRKSLLLCFSKLLFSLEDIYRPDVIFFENVGPMKKRGKEILDEIHNSLVLNEYIVLNPEIHNAADYGVPQNRKRLIFLAIKKNIYNEDKFTWDYFKKKYSVSERVTLKDALTKKKLKILRAGETDPNDPLHTASSLSQLNMRRIKSLKNPGDSRNLWDKSLHLVAHLNYSGHSDVYGRMSWNKPSPTLTTKCFSLSNGRFGHPVENRAISLREAAIIQTMGDFEFGKDFYKEKVARMIGNAVPPLLAKKIGLFIKDLSKSKISH